MSASAKQQKAKHAAPACIQKRTGECVEGDRVLEMG